MTIIDHVKYQKIKISFIRQVTLQTTIKSQKDFNCKRHKYTENKGIVSYFFLIFVVISNFIYIFINFFYFYLLLRHVNNNVFNMTRYVFGGLSKFALLEKA